VKAKIVDEAVIPVKSQPIGSTWEKDFNGLQAELQANIPCYIFYRLDSQNMNGYNWVLFSYVPDGSTVRDRMLYASSRDTVKRQLGLSYFSDDMHGTTKEEFSLESFLEHQKTKNASDQPLTNTEVQTRIERTAEVDMGTSKEYVHSVKFPMSKYALDKLAALNQGSISLVQLKVDPTKETIELAEAKNINLGALSGYIPTNEPRFTLFRWSHDHESEHFNSVVFIYSCTNDSPVKLKMLYSTVKSVASSSCEDIGLKIDKKLEISEAHEITEELLIEVLHPPTEDKKLAFNKPSRPGRGRARLVRGTNT